MGQTKGNVGTEEDDLCNRNGCQGVMTFEKDGCCSCYINPPCPACENAQLVCNYCGESAYN